MKKKLLILILIVVVITTAGCDLLLSGTDTELNQTFVFFEDTWQIATPMSWVENPDGEYSDENLERLGVAGEVYCDIHDYTGFEYLEEVAYIRENYFGENAEITTEEEITVNDFAATQFTYTSEAEDLNGNQASYQGVYTIIDAGDNLIEVDAYFVINGEETETDEMDLLYAITDSFNKAE
jgi:hypothetical protein